MSETPATDPRDATIQRQRAQITALLSDRRALAREVRRLNARVDRLEGERDAAR